MSLKKSVAVQIEPQVGYEHVFWVGVFLMKEGMSV